MSKRFFLSPEQVKEELEKLFIKNLSDWLPAKHPWPLIINLGLPSEKNVLNNLASVQPWLNAWRHWAGPGQLEWVTRRWPRLGEQQLPQKLYLNSIDELTAYIGKQEEWQLALSRYHRFIKQWPALSTVITQYYPLLADSSEQDISRLYAVLQWLTENPNSNLYLRQLPISEIDTKWIETRKSLIIVLLTAIKNINDRNLDFFDLTGLKKEPFLLRMRVLDSNLRKQLGGLSDITAPLTDLAQISLTIKNVFIVENLRTGLAFNDLPNSVIFMKLGYAINCLQHLPWIYKANCFYWGDLDTHGFAILNRARHHLPHLQSLLMDEETLLSHKIYWGHENNPITSENLTCLSEQELQLYEKLRNQYWGNHIRLEQERIPWENAWRVISASKF